MKIEQMESRMAELRDEITALAALDELDETQEARFPEATSEFEALRTEYDAAVEQRTRVDEVRQWAAKPGARVPGTPEAIVRKSDDEVWDVRSVDASPFDKPRYEAAMRDKALHALERVEGILNDPSKEHVDRLLRTKESGRDNAELAHHLLVTGNPAYRSAFSKIVSGDPSVTMALLENDERDALRAAMSTTSSNGGYLIPFLLDPTIILTNSGTQNPFRRISTSKQITVNVWHGVSSAGVTAEWIAEATEVADASPTFSQPTITAYKADAYLQASMEVVADSGIDGEVGMLIADAKDRLESAAFAVGNGTSQPKGIVTALQAVTASRVAGSSGAAGAADLVQADIYALDSALPARHRQNNPVFVAARYTWNVLRKVGQAGTNNNTFWQDFGGGLPPNLIGYPVYQSEEMDTSINSGSNDDSIVFGDFKKYYIADRIGMSLQFNPLVLGSNRRPTGEVGWVAFWRVGADTVDANAFRMLRL